jgi:hypothetical protein
MKLQINKGILAFLIVLFSIPLGHTLMVLNQELIHINKYFVASMIGILGIVLLYLGVKKNAFPIQSTLFGFIGGVLVWTGWIEFSFVWIAEKLNVAPLMENNEITTRSEYLVMMSSIGLLTTVFFTLIFTSSKCILFIWIQKILNIKTNLGNDKRPHASITFFETIMVMWTFYLVLLLVYDNDIAGDKHWATYVVAFGSLFCSIFLAKNLLKVKQFDFAIKYAIPTVVIFWNFVEILGRWNFLKEIWISPGEYWLENSIILAIFSFFIVRALLLKNRKKISV